MKLVVFLCVATLLLADSAAGRKKKPKPKPSKKMPPHIAMEFELLSDAIGQLQQNVSAIWARLDGMSETNRQRSGGVNIYARDGHVDHVQHDHGGDGQHLHMHMHIDSECDHHDHDGRRHNRMHAHAKNQEIHAHCEMKPNPSLPADFPTRVTGQIHLHQNAHGGRLHVHVNLSGFDVSGDDAHHIHGFHIHELGDLTDGCGSLGGHYDASGNDHGAPDAERRHTGDFGNIMCDDEGNVEKQFTDKHASLVGRNSIFGRSIVIHRHEDDMGMNDTPASKSSGDAGPRIACCVIGRARSHGNTTMSGHHGNHVDEDDDDDDDDSHGH